MKTLTILFLYGLTKINGLPITNDDDTVSYLQKFGYLDESTNYRGASPMNEGIVTNALKEFQRFVGIEQTGILDKKTIAAINAPRCGLKDTGPGELTRRKKRYVRQGSRWKIPFLTYSISKYPSLIKDKKLIDDEIARALKTWTDVTNVQFVKRTRGRVNMDVRFEIREHGDNMPFDGPNKILAHAFYPYTGRGDVHFDDDEAWTIGQPVGINLLGAAIHEFGHSLGLNHSDNVKAIMTPIYKNYTDASSFHLHADDILGIQSLYGTKIGNPPISEKEKELPDDFGFVEKEPFGESLPEKVTSSDLPNLCNDTKIDTVTRTKDGKTYVFKGEYYWQIAGGIVKGYPRKISDDWGNMEGNLDASVTWSSGKTFFFKGGRYWRFSNKKMDRRYPKLISAGFDGIPNDLDAAFVWGANGRTYMFKDDQYWRFDSDKNPPVSATYPRPLDQWRRLPKSIDAAFQWENGKTYFFKDDKYYVYDDDKLEAEYGDPPYPRSTGVWWFNCPS